MPQKFSKILFATSIILAFAGLPAHAEKYAVGQKVMADPTGLGNFKSGVVTEVLPFDRYRVQLDDEIGRYEPTVMLERNMKAGGAAPNAAGNAAGTASGGTTNAGSTATGAATNAVGGKFSVGQRVMADGTGIGLFKAGVITEILPFDRFRVQLDEEVGKYGPTVMLLRNMKGGAPAPPTAPAQNAIAATPQAPGNAHTPRTPAAAPNPVHQAPANTTPAAQPHDEHAGADDSPEWHKPGKGAPPSGTYVCESDSPGYAAAGDRLVIQGNTYRGIGQEGGFHPYTLGAINRINWSAGLMSIPDGYTIKHSYYYGPDYMGRPLIKIYYRSKAGWNHCIDCFMGK